LIRPAEATTIQLSTGVLCFSVPILVIPFIFIGDINNISNTSFAAFGSVLWAGITNIVIFVTLFEVIYRRGPVFFSQFNYITPAAALLWAYIIFSQGIETIIWLAIIFMAIGLYLANKGTEKNFNK